MKNVCLFFLLALCAITLVFFACTLDKEPEIPTGVNNITEPVFATAEVISDTNNHFQVTARLSSPGNLNILRHGWVWSETPVPTIQDDSLDLGKLTIDSYSTQITGLDLGKVYYLRPFVSTGEATIYGPEHCSFLGVNFTINAGTEIFKGTEVQFTNTTVGNCTYLWEFGDGGTSTVASPVHTYNTTGNVTVQLTANNEGCVVTRAIVLEITDPFPEDYWVSIPGGSFTMGCTADQEPECSTDDLDEAPAHQVSINPFVIGKTEITQGQWLAIMGDKPSNFDQCGLDCPVENVSWDRIVNEFIPALNQKTGLTHRLPTEAEWEYAARGGQSFKYAGSDDLDLVGWYADITPHPVKLKLPNGFGLYDMSGNVWELVEDDYHADYFGAPIDGSAWIDNPRGQFRVNRGGSWSNGIQSACRVANRGYSDPVSPFSTRGFRLVRID